MSKLKLMNGGSWSLFVVFLTITFAQNKYLRIYPQKMTDKFSMKVIEE